MVILSKGETIQFDWSDGFEGGIIGFYEVLKDFIDTDEIATFTDIPGSYVTTNNFIKFLTDNGLIRQLHANHSWCVTEDDGKLHECLW